MRTPKRDRAKLRGLPASRGEYWQLTTSARLTYQCHKPRDDVSTWLECKSKLLYSCPLCTLPRHILPQPRNMRSSPGKLHQPPLLAARTYHVRPHAALCITIGCRKSTLTNFRLMWCQIRDAAAAKNKTPANIWTWTLMSLWARYTCLRMYNTHKTHRVTMPAQVPLYLGDDYLSNKTEKRRGRKQDVRRHKPQQPSMRTCHLPTMLIARTILDASDKNELVRSDGMAAEET